MPGAGLHGLRRSPGRLPTALRPGAARRQGPHAGRRRLCTVRCPPRPAPGGADDTVHDLRHPDRTRPAHRAHDDEDEPMTAGRPDGTDVVLDQLDGTRFVIPPVVPVGTPLYFAKVGHLYFELTDDPTAVAPSAPDVIVRSRN